MERLWTIITFLHSLAGPLMTLLYPLYSSVIAIESPSKVDDEQWLAYWILHSFLTLMEMLFQPILDWIPIWYDIKLALVVWLVLPQFRGAAFIYEKFVRDNIRKYGIVDRHIHQNRKEKPPTGKAKNKFMEFVTPKKSS